MSNSNSAAQANWTTSKGERTDYGLYFAGQNIFYTLITMFLPTYLVFLGLDVTKAGAVVLIVKLWDALNDAIFGGIFDKVKFKGDKKFLPWLRMSLVAVPLTTILLFVIPRGGTEAAKLTWYVVAYVLWDTAYTICDVPIFGMVTTMTDKLDERTQLMSIGRIFAGVGTAIAMVLGTVLASESVGLSYTVVAVILSITGLGLMTPITVRGKERNITDADREQQFSFKEMFKYLAKNKYLLVYYLGFFFSSGFNTVSTLSLLSAFYLFHNSMLSLAILAISNAPGFIIAFFMPQITKKVDKFKLFFWCNIASVVMGLVIWLVGYENMWVFLGLSALRGIPMGVLAVLMFMFTPDTAEYGKFKTGYDARGITFAIQTFMVKLTAAISSSASLMVLGWFGWKSVEADSFEELASIGIQQSPEALRGLWMAFSLLPVIGAGLAAIIWKFYKLNDKNVQIMADCNTGKITREQADTLLSEEKL